VAQERDDSLNLSSSDAFSKLIEAVLADESPRSPGTVPDEIDAALHLLDTGFRKAQMKPVPQKIYNARPQLQTLQAG